MSLIDDNNSNNNSNNNDDSNKRKRIDDVSSSSTSIAGISNNKKVKTELQTVVDIAGEILLSLLPESKTKEFPDPPMRRLNLVQQIFERNNKLIDGIFTYSLHFIDKF